MKNKLSAVYRRLIPSVIREPLYFFRRNIDLLVLKRRIIKYYDEISISDLTEEHLEVLDFINKYQVSDIPYSYKHNYDLDKIIVNKDEISGLKFTYCDGKKLFFKRSWSDEKIKSYFNDLLIEQDKDSPHRYLTSEFGIASDSIVADVGVAEGNFSLSIVNTVERLYLFEADHEWMEALNATFEPWKEKVTIINSMVSNFNDFNNLSLDNYFKDKEPVTFMKIDVDGAEEVVLEGANNIISSNLPLKLAICTYHKQNDELDFSSMLFKLGFHIECSRGYMIFISGGINNLDKPYLRRGLIRASK